MKFKSKNLFMGLVTFCLVITIFIKFDLLATTNKIYEQIQRIVEVLQAVDKLYFEEVDSQKLVDGAINGILEELDPHSIYIPKDELQEINEQFEGEFEGIGIEFIIHNKWPVIVSPIPDSPSERVGIHSGDKIKKILGVSTYGFSDSEVREKLLGPKGTPVTIEIERPGIADPFNVSILRDKIPIHSVTAAFMLDKNTGYVRVGRFAKTTGKECDAALNQLILKGMTRLILDLRGNSGGYLDQAVELVDKFLTEGKRIVYTRGRVQGTNEDYYASSNTPYPNIPLIVLINHGSASASEIVAGAIQDWDRGLIVGATSFGKGLVQHQLGLKDGSAVRITIARYYTPSGRLIQRSYENGLAGYISEGYDEYDPNAEQKEKLEKPVYTTNGGRKVYGGGGISPDIKTETEQLTTSTIMLIQSRIIFEYASKYTASHKQQMLDFNLFKSGFEVNEKMINAVFEMAKKQKLNINQKEIYNDLAFIKTRIKSQIARNIWTSKEYYEIEVLGDKSIYNAIQYFPEANKIIKLTHGK